MNEALKNLNLVNGENILFDLDALKKNLQNATVKEEL